MKTQLGLIALAAGALLAATPEAGAFPPRQHSASGVVEAINWTNRTIILKTKAAAVPLILFWNESTRFKQTGGCARQGFEAGQTVRGWYRREAGRNVLREVSTKADAADCCATR